MAIVSTIEDLEALYGRPAEASLIKEADRITPEYRTWIEASPFAALATCGPDGLDCSPRGDEPGFVRVQDERTLLVPDRRGNNRIDSLRNILYDPRVALLFLIPGIGETLRVNGRAAISADPDLLAGFTVGDKRPRTVVVVTVDSVFFQCSRAIVRSDLWNPAKHAPRHTIPSPGRILAARSADRIDGAAYDEALPERVRQTLY